MKKIVSMLATCLITCLLITGIFSSVAFAAGETVYDIEVHLTDNPLDVITVQYQNVSKNDDNPTKLILPDKTPGGLKIGRWYEDKGHTKIFNQEAFEKAPKEGLILYAVVPNNFFYHYARKVESHWHVKGEDVTLPNNSNILGWYTDPTLQTLADVSALKNIDEDVDLYPKYKDGTKIDFSLVEAVKPDVKTIGFNRYYEIKERSTKILDSEGYYIKASAMQAWKWVVDNVSYLCNEDNVIVLIEEDLNFDLFNSLKTLSHNNMASTPSSEFINSPITFSIMGGQIIDNKVENIPRLISNFNLELNDKNVGFVDKLDNNAVISNLHFDSCNYTTPGSGPEYIGGIVGVINNGKISKVSCTNFNINTSALAIGGLVGKLINGEISNCDFQGKIESTNVEQNDVGGLVGNITMGDLINNRNQVNDIKIHDSYFIGDLNVLENTYVAGIIGNIDFKEYDYKENVANINVNSVYSLINNFTTNILNPSVAYGILGHIVMNADGIVFPGPPPITDPKDPNYTPDPSLLPIQNVKFNIVISQDKLSDKILAQFPKEFLSPERVSANNTISVDQYGNISSFSKPPVLFDNSIWTMPEKKEGEGSVHYELKYKFEKKLKSIKVKSVGNAKSSSSIIEKNNVDEVTFIEGSPIVMTIEEQDGVHVNTIIAQINDASTGTKVADVELYKTTTVNPGGTIDQYNITNEYIEYDYVNSRLKIKCQNDGTYKLNATSSYNILDPNYDVTITFDFSITDAGGNPSLAYNIYNAKLKTYKSYDIEKEPTDKELEKYKLDYIENSHILIKPKDETNPIPYNDYIEKIIKEGKIDRVPVDHSEILNVYIGEGALYDNVLDKIVIKSESGFEALENKPAKGWVKKGNCEIDGKWYERYEIKLNFLNKDIHHREDINIHLLFVGRPVKITDYKSIRFAEQTGKDLIHNGLLDATFITTKNPQGINYVKNGDLVRIQFSLSDIGKSSQLVFNFENGTNSYTKGFNIKFNNQDLAVEYDITKHCFITEEFNVVNGSEIVLNLVKTKRINIKDSVGTYNPPSYKVDNIPIIVDGSYIVGYAEAVIGYDKVLKKPDEPDEPPYDYVSDVRSRKIIGNDGKERKITDSPKELLDTILVKQTNSAYQFITIGEKHNISLVEDNLSDGNKYYTHIEGYKKNKDFIKSKVDATSDSIQILTSDPFATNIDLKYIVPERDVKIYTKVGEEMVDGTTLVKYQYGSRKVISRTDYVSKYEKDFHFDGWEIIKGKEINGITGISITGEQVDLIKEVEFKNPDAPIEDTLNIIIKLTPYHWLKVINNDSIKGKLYCDGTFKDREDTKFFTDVTEEIKNRVYTVRTSNPKYLLDVETMTINPLVDSVTQDKADNTLWRITINYNSLNDLTLTNYEANLLEQKIDIIYKDRILEATVNITAFNDDDTVMDILPAYTFGLVDSQGDNIECIMPLDLSSNIIQIPKIVYGESLTFRVQTSSLFDIYWTINNVPIRDGVNTEKKAETRESIYKLNDLTEDKINIGIKFKKLKQFEYFAIDTIPVRIEGKDKPAYFSDVKFKFDFGDTINTPSKIQGAQKVIISADIVNPKYEMVCWESTYDGSGTATTELVKNTNPYFIIDSIDGNFNTSLNPKYKLNLVLKEKQRTLTITAEHGGIELVIHDSTKKEPIKHKFENDVEAKNGYKIEVPYGTNIVLDFIDNKDYVFNRWENMTIINQTCKTRSYDIGQLIFNQEIKLVMDSYVEEIPDPDEDITPTIKIQYQMKYDEVNAKTGKVVGKLGPDGTKVVLTAKPDNGAVFTKWYVKEGEDGSWTEFEGNDKATIEVDNTENMIYAALFDAKQVKLNFTDNDIVTVAGKNETEYGSTITIEANAKQGYTVDKVVINGGEKVIVLGNVKKFTLYNVTDDQNISFVYRKVAPTAEDESMKDGILIMIIVTVVIAIIVSISAKHIIKKTGTARKHKKIKINID